MYWQPIRCHTTPWFWLADDTLQVSFSELDVRRCHQHTLDVLWDMTSEVELFLTLWLFCSLLRNSLEGGSSLIKAELRNTFSWNELMEGYFRGTFLHVELASRISTWIFEVVIVLWPLKSQINALKPCRPPWFGWLDVLAVYIDEGLLFTKWFSWGGKYVELLEQDASPCLLKGARVSFYNLPPPW
jgi:hypothetical protein